VVTLLPGTVLELVVIVVTSYQKESKSGFAEF